MGIGSGVLGGNGKRRIVLEVIVVTLVFYTLASLALVPFLKGVAPDVFAGTVEYGRWDSPDSVLDYTHLGFVALLTFSYLLWRLCCTELGRQYRESTGE
jgi:hypothetical protein